MSGDGTGMSEDLGRVLSDVAKALFERRGEAATVDQTRVPPAPKRDPRGDAADEATK
jgi:hypothetical protein